MALKWLFSSRIWSVLCLFVCMDTMIIIWACNLFVASYWLFGYLAMAYLVRSIFTNIVV